MLIGEILKDCEIIKTLGEEKDLDIQKLSCNSKEDQKGSLYFCIKGEKVNGHTFAGEVAKMGAKALVVEKFLSEVPIPQYKVLNSRKAMSLCAKNFYSASDKLKLIAVTGTNGKTTTANIVKSIMQSAGKKIGVIGTMGAYYDNEQIAFGLTTPDPIELHRIFSEMEKRGAEYVVMEASAHALALDKLEGLKFQTSIFTNLSQDHLDFFNNMRNYAYAKSLLFTPKYSQTAVVNADDIMGRKLWENSKIPTISYGINEVCNCFAINLESKDCGNRFDMNLFDNFFTVQTMLYGEYNVSNCLGASVACFLCGIEPEKIRQGLESASAVEGRYNVVNVKDFNVVVDFAHTPDGIEKVLKSARKMCNGKLICIFGCGGNRDKTKRPLMAKIAEQCADYCIVTSDNPRDENPYEIMKDISDNFSTEKHVCIENRASAISYGMGLCRAGDTLVICGKGGEHIQEISGKKIPFDDLEEVRKAKKLREMQ